MQKIQCKFLLHILHSRFWPSIKPQGHTSNVNVKIFKLPYGRGFGQNTLSSRTLLQGISGFSLSYSSARPEELNQPSRHDWQQKHKNLQGRMAAEQQPLTGGLWPNTSRDLAVSTHFNEIFNHIVIYYFTERVKRLLSEEAILEGIQLCNPKLPFKLNPQQ